MTKPWDKQPGETEANYLAFRRYLDMGPDRSVLGAYRAHLEEDKGRTRAQASRARVSGAWKRASKKHDWLGRSTQFDASITAQMSKAHEEALEAQVDEWARRQVKLREDEWGVSQQALQRAREILNNPPDNVSYRDAAQLLRIASEVGRAATRLGEDGGTAKVVREHADEILDGQSAMELERTYRELFGDA